ncbi:MAG: hypothetical protein AB1776_07095 [Bacillota bacterium]
MMVALLHIGRLSGRLCCDGRRIYLEDAAEEIARAVEPYLHTPVLYKTQEWRGKERVVGEAVAQPGTIDHFSALVWHYLPHRAGVRVACVWPKSDEEEDEK